MDLRDYLHRLDAIGELERINEPVSCSLEISCLARSEFRKLDGGKAQLFTNVSGSACRVVTNLFGSDSRLCALLQSDSLAAFDVRLKDFFTQRAGSSNERLKQLNATPLGHNQYHTQNEIVDLTRLPAIQSWPREGGRYLTLGLGISRHRQTGAINIGIYRAQMQSATTLAVNFAPGSDAAINHEAAKAMNEPFSFSLVLGGDPALIWAAAAPLPSGVNEFDLCQTLISPDLKLYTSDTTDLPLPVSAELILEGFIDPKKTTVEGPFGNHTGQYVTRNDCPLFHVTSVAQRSEAIVPMTVVGPPPSETVQLAKASEILIRNMLAIDYPQVCGLKMPLSTFYHGAALLQVKNSSPSDNRDLIQSLWQNSPLQRSKLLILLDQDIDIESAADCWWRTVNRLAGERVYQDKGRLAIDATGVNPATLIVEDIAGEGNHV